nr:MAG TPA: hypothetical protein [Bacteriophage sp.]DAV91404.1 MAG TPA: hypothetical protein [Bacteriophage sp.]
MQYETKTNNSRQVKVLPLFESYCQVFYSLLVVRK